MDEGRYDLDVRRMLLGWYGTYTYTGYGGFDLGPLRMGALFAEGWWRPTRRGIERKLRRETRG